MTQEPLYSQTNFTRSTERRLGVTLAKCTRNIFYTMPHIFQTTVNKGLLSDSNGHRFKNVYSLISYISQNNAENRECLYSTLLVASLMNDDDVLKIFEIAARNPLSQTYFLPT